MIPKRDRLAVSHIRHLQQTYRSLSDGELLEKAQEYRTRYKGEQAREELFALIAVAIHRALDMEPFDEQLAGALAMADGHVAQMQTGQGKTLTALFPAMLYACSGPAWIATANPYLARRDAEWMRSVYERLGFTVGVTEAKMSTEEKQAAYACDIVYGTHSEFGFDYLRDRLAVDPEKQVQKEPFFMLVDEVDSILLDEAVTPMILSGAGPELDQNLLAVDRFAGWLKSEEIYCLDDEDEYYRLEESVDYFVVRRDRVAMLTDLGQRHAETFFRIEDLSAHPALYHLIFQAIQAYGVFRKDVDYIVRDGKLQIVDPHTGRVMDGRRYCNGLWQALEVKERLDVVKESRTLASISYQQYFRRFPYLAGMTGTAWEGRNELLKIYRMPVRVIPPHQKERRISLPDVYGACREEQIARMVQEVRAAHEKGQPCLLVTRSVADSEELAEALKAEGLNCEVLNAANDAREAGIIAGAGRSGQVTVATAMAGRGTDIVIDEQARLAGGLYVMGLGHQDTRRGDRQLCGRSGRQGDPGVSRFFISPDDEPVRRFCYRIPQNRRQCLKAVRHAQEVHETTAEGQRRTTLKLDEAVGAFRDQVYAKRNEVLKGSVPDSFSGYPQEAARRVLLSAIDEMWAVFLDEAEDAKMGIGLVSLAGKNYEVDYIRKVTDLYHAMEDEVERISHERLSGMKDDHPHVSDL